MAERRGQGDLTVALCLSPRLHLFMAAPERQAGNAVRGGHLLGRQSQIALRLRFHRHGSEQRLAVEWRTQSVSAATASTSRGCVVHGPSSASQLHRRPPSSHLSRGRSSRSCVIRTRNSFKSQSKSGPQSTGLLEVAAMGWLSSFHYPPCAAAPAPTPPLRARSASSAWARGGRPRPRNGGNVTSRQLRRGLACLRGAWNLC